MKNYSHLFYNKLDLDLDTKIEILEYSKSKSYDWWVDELDCSKSWSRVKVEMSFDDIMDLFDSKCHFSIIHRRGYKPKSEDLDDVWRWYGEVGFCTMVEGVNHYLWLKISEDDLGKLVKDFNLILI